jgi:hypothetical protein
VWENISRTDLNQAKQHLKECREKMLHRHAEEVGVIDGEQAEIETLEQFIVAFIEKFQRVKPSSSEAPADKPAGRSETHSNGKETPEVIRKRVESSSSSTGNLYFQHLPTRGVQAPWDLEAASNS